MHISEMTVSEQWKGKLNSRKFYRHKNYLLFLLCPILLHKRSKKTNYFNFSVKQWINLIFFLNFAVTIVLNHGQNDEK